MRNQSSKTLTLKIKSISQNQLLEVITPVNPIELLINGDKEIHIFIKFSPTLLNNGQSTASVILENAATDDIVVEKPVHLVGPGTL